ncbi:hypothetical protein [Sinomicrobium soli]|uniref:hypothetical protein n=1 Tax=Sinomicrobium sp. N-1-3-6 TaxID=2219864 RepID=UPI000DCE8706|nr:hypothetical protein [Sinomicrobium sp. N-1-3-6]RAV30414.1 hypothetical protein DN748_02600 [Sinomicrobium sp. N-1-3-6]
MMTKTLYLILSAPIGSVLIIATLFLLADNKPDRLQRDYSVGRALMADAIIQDTVLDIQYNSYYIAGTTDDRLYLGNVTSFLHLLSIDTTLTDTTHISVRIKNGDGLVFRSPSFKIQAPYVYLTDGVMPGLFRGRLGQWEVQKFMVDSAYFTKIVPTGPKNFVIRAMQASSRQYVLGTLQDVPPYLNLASLLQKQVDGVFDVDGNLLYNRERDQVVYVYYYRNQFLVTDPELNLIYEGKTIDTFSRVQLNPVHVSSGKTHMLAAPPKMVNGNSTTKGNFLLVNSKIMGRNDDEDLYSRSSVIDVYGLEQGAYRFSFYLPGYNGRSARDFRIVGNKLIAQYEHHIVTYTLNKKYFPQRELNNIHPEESGDSLNT